MRNIECSLFSGADVGIISEQVNVIDLIPEMDQKMAQSVVEESRNRGYLDFDETGRRAIYGYEDKRRELRF
jgi:hypothetical protein